MNRQVLAFAALLALLVWSILGTTALVAHQRAVTRGIPAGLPEPVSGSDVTPLCVNAALAQYNEKELAWALDLIDAGGFAWVRQTFSWARIEPTAGAYDWAAWDAIVEAATARHLRIIAVLDDAPTWAGTPPPADAFARFAAAFAARYGAQIDEYQVWNNPNLRDGWGSNPNPSAYAHLLQQAAEAIRAADPGARILLGSLAPTTEQGPENLSEGRFLERLYVAGAAPFFDILAVQAYGFDTGPDDRRVDEGVLNFSRSILLRERMIAHGDGEKAVWASHLGWNAPSAGETIPSIWGEVDAETQAAYTVAAIERARREWPWMGALCLAHFQPDPDRRFHTSGTPDAAGHWGFALVAPDGEPRPVYRAVAALAAAQPLNAPGAYTPLSGVATWEGDWEFSELGADVSEAGGERVTIPFWGTDFGLRVRRANYRGTFYVAIDGKPANALPRDEEGRAYLTLTSPDYAPQVLTIPVAEGLEAGPHVAVVEADRGWDQWALAGWSVAYHADDRAYRAALAVFCLLMLLCLCGLVVTGRRVAWGALGAALAAGWRQLGGGAQLLIAAAVTALLWASAWMTWGLEAGNAFRRLGDGAGIAAVLAAAALFYYSPWFLLTILAALVLFILILLRPELGLALIAALAPFYTLPRPLLDKAFSMAEIVTLFTLAAWLLRRPLAHLQTCKLTHLYTRTPADLPTLLLVIVAILSTLFADFQRVAWRELRLVIIEPALFYLMLRTTHLERRDVWRIVDFFIAGGVAVALIGLMQYALGINLITAEAGLPRLRSVYGSPNNVGLYLGRVLPLLIAIPLFGRCRWRRIVYGLAALPVALALLLTFSKGALLLGVPASLLTIGLLTGGRWLWVTLGGIAAAALAAIPLLRHPRFASLLDTQGGTTFFRLKLWQATWSMIRDHPWLGVGPDNFLYQYRGRYILPSAWQEPDLSHPHNFLLDHWSRLGILGLAAGIWLQAAFWRTALPLRRLRDADSRALALGFMGAMADMLAHGLVDHSFFLIDLAFVFFLIVGLIPTLRQEPTEP